MIGNRRSRRLVVLVAILTGGLVGAMASDVTFAQSKSKTSLLPQPVPTKSTGIANIFGIFFKPIPPPPPTKSIPTKGTPTKGGSGKGGNNDDDDDNGGNDDDDDNNGDDDDGVGGNDADDDPPCVRPSCVGNG